MAFIKLTYEKLTYECFIIQFNLNGQRRSESAQVPRTYYDSAQLSDILDKWDSLVCEVVYSRLTAKGDSCL
jgi:hypothetical protein